MQPIKSSIKIGVIDSGAGGLTVLSALLRANAGFEYHYFADDAFSPYGGLSIENMRLRLKKICHFMVKIGVRVLVIACNTATLSAISYIRDLPIILANKLIVVGIEPAVKPAASMLKKGVVSVLATPVSCESQRLQSLIQNSLDDNQIVSVEYHCIPSHILAKAIDELPDSMSLVESELRRVKGIMREVDSQTLVLACTHYPLILPMFELLLGSSIRIIEPSQAVANRVFSRIEQELDMASVNEFQKNLCLYSSAGKKEVNRLRVWLETMLGQASMSNWVVFNQAYCIQD